MTAWTALEDRLASTFRHVSDRVFLIIASEADPARYVQFAGHASRLDAEAPGTDVVADADESVLKATGWTAPVPAQPNWSSSLMRPALSSEYRELAARCVATLRDAYGIASPDELGYRSWREAEWMPEGETWDAERVKQLDPGEDALELASLGLASI